MPERLEQPIPHPRRMGPTGRPDLDNLIKCLDSFNGVVWRDDAQVVSGTIRKAYSDKPRLVVTVEAAL